MLDAETGEMVEKELEHENSEVRKFYAGLPEPALIGIESTSYTRWFAEMLTELGHELAGCAGRAQPCDEGAGWLAQTPALGSAISRRHHELNSAQPIHAKNGRILQIIEPPA